MNNTIIQWVNENTRLRGENKPSRLDLLFTKGINIEKYINYKCLLGRSNHVVLDIEIKRDMEDK